MTRGGPLKRKTPLRPSRLLVRDMRDLLRGTKPKRRTALRVVGDSDRTTILNNIQALLRELAIRRDGGCVLRHYADARACGGYTKAGELILQAEHLNSRKRSVSYADMRNIVCICKHHDLHFKKEEPLVYWHLIRLHIGEQRWAWLQRVTADKRPHRFYLADWKLTEAALKAELRDGQ